MIKESYRIYSSRSTQLYSVSWQRDQTPEAIIFIVHGLGEHHGRYEEMAKIFVENNITAFAFDQRGHGLSEGKRGHADSIDQYVEDVEHVLMKCRSLFLDIPIFLFGHSMGGQIVAAYLDKVKSKEVSGAIISSPWIKINHLPSKWLIKLINQLAKVFPSFTVSNGLDPNDISNKKDEVDQYINDPLNHDKASISLFKSLFAKGLYLSKKAHVSKLPVLVCHGSEDKITDPQATAEYANLLGAMAEFKLWKKSKHELIHDFEKDKVISSYINWVKQHTKRQN